MKALVLRDTATLPAIEDVENPAPGAGEVLVRVAAAALNHRELFICQGQYPGMALPATLGADGVGTVTAVGEGVGDALLGRMVLLYPGLGWGEDPAFPAADFALLGMPGPGTIAEQISVSANSVFDVPSHLDPVQAAALPLAGLTAWRGLMTKAGLKAGDRLLITGVGGGVAAQALAFAVAHGARVWVTSGSDATIEWAVEQGAAGGVNYRTEGWGKELRRQSGGIDVVFDGAPAAGFKDYSRSLGMGARVVIYGSTGGVGFPVVAPELFLKNWTISGTNVGNVDEFAAMLAFVSQHRLMPAIDKRFVFADAPDALAYLQSSHGFGKVVVTMSESG